MREMVMIGVTVTVMMGHPTPHHRPKHLLCLLSPWYLPSLSKVVLEGVSLTISLDTCFAPFNLTGKISKSGLLLEACTRISTLHPLLVPAASTRTKSLIWTTRTKDSCKATC